MNTLYMSNEQYIWAIKMGQTVRNALAKPTICVRARVHILVEYDCVNGKICQPINQPNLCNQ